MEERAREDQAEEEETRGALPAPPMQEAVLHHHACFPSFRLLQPEASPPTPPTPTTPTPRRWRRANPTPRRRLRSTRTCRLAPPQQTNCSTSRPRERPLSPVFGRLTSYEDTAVTEGTVKTKTTAA